MVIFCIGLNKTATISLHEALETLGFRSLHWGGPEVREKVERAIAENRPLLHYLPGFDAFSDILRLSENFALLDRQYPGSRFIYTTRAVEQWLESRRRHVERNVERRAQGLYDGAFLEIEDDAWRAEFTAHDRAVRSYFASRPDLLVMDITAGDGYEKLCPFLGVDPPDQAFPWRHRQAPHES